eukprot:jgi/Galph1/273/GphlegSOOS_G5074.1
MQALTQVKAIAEKIQASSEYTESDIQFAQRSLELCAYLKGQENIEPNQSITPLQRAQELSRSRCSRGFALNSEPLNSLVIPTFAAEEAASSAIKEPAEKNTDWSELSRELADFQSAYCAF